MTFTLEAKSGSTSNATSTAPCSKKALPCSSIASGASGKASSNSSGLMAKSSGAISDHESGAAIETPSPSISS